SDEQEEIVRNIYDELNVDQVLLESNKLFKLQGINHILLHYNEKTKRTKLLPLHNHQIFPIIDPTDSTEAIGYCVPTKDLKQFTFYLENEITITDQNGSIINSIKFDEPRRLPIVAIRQPVLHSYWPETGTTLTDFTIQFNAILSDIANIVRMQGFAQAYLKGDVSNLPQNIKIGPNSILMLPVNPNNPVDTEFGFASPSPDLSGSLEFLRSLLSSFLSSRGLSPRAISTQGSMEEFSSGLDRMLAAMERFEASEQDQSIFYDCERQLLRLLVSHLNETNPTFGFVDEETVTLDVRYEKPSAIMSDKDRLDAIERQKEIGLISDIDALMQWHGISRAEAEQKAREILQANFTGGIINE
ncbi:MAG: hypothetical protein QXT45_04265, partial [Candidatus Bilamarchaeaceae archaeon]